VARSAGRLGGEAGLVEGAVEPVAGAVAGEHAAGSVGTVCAGREAQNQDAGVGSPNEGTAFPQYSQSRKARRLTAAMRSQCSRKRGQRQQFATSFCRVCKISSTGLFNGKMLFGCSGRLSDSALAFITVVANRASL